MNSPKEFKEVLKTTNIPWITLYNKVEHAILSDCHETTLKNTVIELQALSP